MTCDTPDHVDHQVEGDAFAVVVAEARSDGVAGGRQRAGAGEGRDGACADRIPDIHDSQQIGVLMEPAQFGAALVDGRHSVTLRRRSPRL
jgi:hypothetical protein